MTDNNGELIKSSKDEPKEPVKDVFGALLENRFKNFTRKLTEKGKPFIYSPKIDLETGEQMIGTTQTYCEYFDVLPNNPTNVASRPELFYRASYEDLQRENGNSREVIPLNVLGRFAYRVLDGKPVYTIEVWNKIDAENAIKFADIVYQEIGRAVPAYIQINALGRSKEDLTTRLDLALHLVEDNLRVVRHMENEEKPKSLSAPTLSIPHEHPKAPTTEPPENKMVTLINQIEAMKAQYQKPKKNEDNE